MPRTLTLAAVQMNAEPAPTAERLARAEKLVVAAAQQGAQLIVLPEVFNTGYAYTADNYARAEPLSGPTVMWLKRVAREYNVHLSGTLFLRDADDIFNTQLIVAPDGRLWRYDKIYPWVWERAYFREGHHLTVAETDLGRLGMLICWDQAHANLWEGYAGQVDLMVIPSCPPRVHDLALAFPDGQRLTAAAAGPLFAQMRASGEGVFTTDVQRKAAWMGVPVVTTSGAGRYDTSVPLPEVSLSSYVLLRPDLWRQMAQARAVRVQSDYFRATRITDGQGQVLGELASDEETFTLATVSLPDTPPRPLGPAPQNQLSPAAYILDAFANVLLAPVYRRAVRQTYGPQMAPMRRDTKIWLGVTLAALGVGLLLGWWWRRR